MTTPALDLPPPHEGDWFTTTSDAIDYARWLDQRVNAFASWLAGPDAAQTPTPQAAIVNQFVPWAAQWKAADAAIKVAWWDTGWRYDPQDWSTVERFHTDLLNFEQLAADQGMVNAPKNASTPGLLPTPIAQALDQFETKATTALTLLLVAGVVVGVGFIAVETGAFARARRALQRRRRS